MTANQIVIFSPQNTIPLAKLKELGYQLYAYCEGISELVEIRNVSPTQVEIGHWGYHWVPLSRVMKVIASKLEPDKRSENSQTITQTLAPNQPTLRRRPNR